MGFWCYLVWRYQDCRLGCFLLILIKEQLCNIADHFSCTFPLFKMKFKMKLGWFQNSFWSLWTIHITSRSDHSWLGTSWCAYLYCQNHLCKQVWTPLSLCLLNPSIRLLLWLTTGLYCSKSSELYYAKFTAHENAEQVFIYAATEYFIFGTIIQ